MRVGSEAMDALRSWRGTLRELGDGTVLLTYVVAPERVWVILTTADIQVARKSDVGAAELNKLVFDFRKALLPDASAGSGAQLLDPRPLAQALYRHLISPLARELDAAKARTLMLSLDGSLRYVPMGALHDGQRYLVERYRFTMLTEAAKTQITKKPVANWSVAALGLTREVPGFSPLQGVREELEGLVRAPRSKRGVLRGEMYLDELFTGQRLTSLLV